MDDQAGGSPPIPNSSREEEAQSKDKIERVAEAELGPGELSESEIEQVAEAEPSDENLAEDQVIESYKALREDKRAVIQACLRVSGFLLPLFIGALYFIIHGNLKLQYPSLYVILLFLGIIGTIFTMKKGIETLLDTTILEVVRKADYNHDLERAYKRESEGAEDTGKYLKRTFWVIIAIVVLFGAECITTDLMIYNGSNSNNTDTFVIVIKEASLGNISVFSGNLSDIPGNLSLSELGKIGKIKGAQNLSSMSKLATKTQSSDSKASRNSSSIIALPSGHP